MSTANANKLHADVTKGMDPQMVAIMEFFTFAEKLKMGVHIVGGTVEVSRRLSEPKMKLVLLIIDLLRSAENNQLIPEAKHADAARKTWEEFIKHMHPNEYEKFDEAYISAMEHGELTLQKLMS